MPRWAALRVLAIAALFVTHTAEAGEVDGAGLYARYCALCHGADREGHAADHAPSGADGPSEPALPLDSDWARTSGHGHGGVR